MDAEIGKAEEQEDEKDGAWMPSSRLFGMSADGTLPFFFFFNNESQSIYIIDDNTGMKSST